MAEEKEATMMDVREAIDKSGNKFKYKTYDGANYQVTVPGSVKEQLSMIGNIEYLADDTIILSYLKSGTHWMYEIANMIKTSNAEYHEEILPILDYLPLEFLGRTPPRTFTSHLFTRHLPEKFLKNKGKIIYVYRNPKDVSVSYYTFIKKMKIIAYEGTWEDFYDMWLRGECLSTWFEHVKDVAEFKAKNPDYPILTVSYENMKKDLETEVKKIAAFLQPSVDNELCKQIAEKCQFSMMQPVKDEKMPKLLKQAFKSESNVFYRKGEVGDWKNWYTVAMNETFDDIYEKEMTGVDLDVKFTI